MSKKLLIPVFTGILLIVAVSFFVLWQGSKSLETEFATGKTVLLDFTSINCVNPVSVLNARWQIAMLVTNRGTRPLLISRVYVNEKPVDLYGLAHGDTLQDGNLMGTSVPKDGVRLDPGESSNVYVWVGNKLYSSGSRIVIHFNDPNSVTLMKSITLS
jgi:archaellum component FlaG (FlaF/FlaG flagellin family)